LIALIDLLIVLVKHDHLSVSPLIDCRYCSMVVIMRLVFYAELKELKTCVKFKLLLNLSFYMNN